MKLSFPKILNFLSRTFLGTLLENATSYVEQELEELENLFAMLVFSPLVGIATIPPIVSLSLLPYMEEEIIIALDRSLRSDDPYSLIGFDIE